MSRIRKLVMSELTGHCYRTDWYCIPPPAQFPFQVTDAEWTTEGEVCVREIYGWMLVPDRQAAAPLSWPVSEHVALQVVAVHG